MKIDSCESSDRVWVFVSELGAPRGGELGTLIRMAAAYAATETGVSSNPAYIVDADKKARIHLRQLLEVNGLSCRPFQSGSDLIEALPHLPAGIVLIDIGTAGENGFDVIEAVARTKLACPIIGMTEMADLQIAVACIRRGAVDFLVKPVDPDELASVVTGAREILIERVTVFERAKADQRLLERLTQREATILEMIAAGRCNKSIAGELEISVRTVESYRAAIVDKLEVANSTAAATLLARHQAALQAHSVRIAAALGG